ncbi:MAG: SWIM zinc finger family protein [Desulfobulbaceae bacterium]|nr:SWIM zinc finger family protein [Desulfobulbaceae bacterium]
MSRYGWRPYVPVAQRRTRALQKMEKLRKKGFEVKPIPCQSGRKMARTFWGQAWCDHIESFHDYENRLPRGRTYLRNGSVCHLDIAPGKITAKVCGSELYSVTIAIKPLAVRRWQAVKKRCAGQIGSLLELLQGRLSEKVMAVVTDPANGLFPRVREIELQCSCPDWAEMCKHVAAVLYGVGVRLDEQPELLFLLRGVDHQELIDTDVTVATGTQQAGSSRHLAEGDLADLFGIEFTEEPVATPPALRRKKGAAPARKSVRAPSRRATEKSGREKENPPSAGTRQGTAAAADDVITGAAVAELRAFFDMSQSEFARLLGVSVPSVWNWEKKSGVLNLQARTLRSWLAVKALTKQQARRKLSQR